MLLREEDIRRVFENVDVAVLKIVTRVLGQSYITKADIGLLKKHGVDLVKLLPKFPSYYQAFLFGRLSSALGKQPTSRMKYSEFAKFLPKMGLFEPNTREMAFYRIAADKTYSHIKGFGEKIKEDIRAAISAEEMNLLQQQERAKAERVLHEEILDGTLAKRSVKKISSRIADRMQAWNRDWSRIVETESQDVYNLGRAVNMMSEDADPIVYFQVFPGACRHCIRLYLTRGIGSRPKTFRLSELMANGTNYGLKSSEWKPTVHPVHPYCRCEIVRLPKGYVWNEERGEFAPPEKYERRVERKSKVRITIGNKEYEV